MNSNSSSTKETHAYYQGCPYLGLPDDPQTTLLFPAPRGFCHRAYPPEAVQLAHQQTYCLTLEHVQCPVYKASKRRPLPLMLREPAYEELVGHSMTWQRVVTVATIILFVGLSSYWGMSRLPDNQESGNELVVAAPNPTETATAPLLTQTSLPIVKLPTHTPTAVATKTPLPTATSTPTIVPTETPIPTPIVTATFTTTIPLPSTSTLVNVTLLDVYQEPSTAAPVILRVSQIAVTFAVIGQNSEGSWLQVCCVNDENGWILAETVDLSQAAVLPSPSPPQASVNVDTLNVRSGPGTDYPILSQIDNGTQYDVVGRLNNPTWWQLCCFAGEPGWVIAGAVTIEGNIASIPLVRTIPPVPIGEP